MDEQKKNPKKKRHDKNRYQKPSDKQIQCPLCPLCEKPVREILSAINEKQTNKPAHFECIMKQLEGQEPLKDTERICYLGKGIFGIIKDEKSSVGFSIIKKIQYEKEDEVPSWRKEQLDRYLR